MALPVAKLALMGLKIITKPIANQVKSQAKNHETFRKFCIGFGRTINSVTVWANNRILSRTPSEGSKRFVLSESQAIDRGADAVGELATFFLIGVPVVGIYWAESAEKDRAKEAARLEKEAEARAMNERFQQIEHEVLTMRNEMQKLSMQLDGWYEAQDRILTRLESAELQSEQVQVRRWWSPWGIFG